MDGKTKKLLRRHAWNSDTAHLAKTIARGAQTGTHPGRNEIRTASPASPRWASLEFLQHTCAINPALEETWLMRIDLTVSGG